MSEPEGPAEDQEQKDPKPEAEWERKRRLAEVFGDVLPGSTRDDRDEGSSAERESASDRWLKSQVPPHHGG